MPLSIVHIDILGFSAFQSAKELELPVTLNDGLENNERALVPGETVSPSSNSQFPSGTVAPSTLMAENASTLGSLKMVCLTDLPNFILSPSCSCESYCMNFSFFCLLLVSIFSRRKIVNCFLTHSKI